MVPVRGEEEMVMVPLQDYNRLLNDADILSALLAFGVDNWDGYDDAIISLEEFREDF